MTLSKTPEKLIRRNLKILRGDNISAIRNRRNESASHVQNDKSLREGKLFEFLSRKKPGSNGPDASLLLRKAVPAMTCSSVSYLAMQYLFHRKNRVSFDPVRALNHFIVPGSAESLSFEVTEHSEEGHGDDGISEGEVTTVSSGVGLSRLDRRRFEILKMRASRRPTHVASSEAQQSEQPTPES